MSQDVRFIILQRVSEKELAELEQLGTWTSKEQLSSIKACHGNRVYCLGSFCHLNSMRYGTLFKTPESAEQVLKGKQEWIDGFCDGSISVHALQITDSEAESLQILEASVLRTERLNRRNTPRLGNCRRTPRRDR